MNEVNNILEFIKALLPVSETIHLNELALDEYGLLIEETGARGRIDSFQGYDGVISSTIQLYLRTTKSQGSYVRNTKKIKDYYKIVQENKGLENGKVKLLWVDTFTMATFKDSKGNSCYSILFPVIYKESE